MKPKNLIILTGTIERVTASSRLAICRIIIEGGTSPSYLNVSFYEPVKVESYKAGERVTIRGHVQNRNGKDGHLIKEHIQDIVGDDIRIANGLQDDNLYGEEETGYECDRNLAVVAGKVVHIFYPNPELCLLTVSVSNFYRGRRGYDYCNLSCFGKQTDIAADLTEGDFVAAAGYVRENRIMKDGNERTVLNIISQELLEVPEDDAAA